MTTVREATLELLPRLAGITALWTAVAYKTPVTLLMLRNEVDGPRLVPARVASGMWME